MKSVKRGSMDFELVENETLYDTCVRSDLLLDCVVQGSFRPGFRVHRTVCCWVLAFRRKIASGLVLTRGCRVVR